MRACVVHSVDIDSSDTVAELIAGAKVALGASLPRVAMLFAGIDHDFAIVLEQINARWPGIALIGCTTDGEMSSHILFAEDSLALVLLSGDDFHAVSGVAKSVSTDVAGSIRASANDAVQRLVGRCGAPRNFHDQWGSDQLVGGHGPPFGAEGYRFESCRGYSVRLPGAPGDPPHKGRESSGLRIVVLTLAA